VRLSLFVLALGAILGPGGCAGCSEQCSGDKQGSETCPCASDQDCTTRLGTVLLCTQGTCTRGDPPDSAGKACNGDGDCGAGEACGIDGTCAAAPSCQRIDSVSADTTTPVLKFTLATGETGDVNTARQDCVHHWAATSGAGDVLNVDVTIDLDGAMTVTDHGGAGCSAGHWFAGRRIGAITCGATVWAIAPVEESAAVCVGGGCDAACEQLGDTTVGVCP
jgi:hypothetical protein